MIIHLKNIFSECCEELEIKGDKNSIFGKYKLKNETQDSMIQYARIADNAGKYPYILAKSRVSGWKVRFPKNKYDDFFSSLKYYNT